MYVIGITGPVASGKSTLARQFAQLGATLVDADQIGHEVLREPEVVAQLVDRWGERILAPDGQIDRSAVAQIVFAPGGRGQTELEYLQSVSHPRITRRINEQIAEQRSAGAPAVVLDAALLVEAGWDEYCDRTVFVEVPRSKRLDRALARGWTEAGFSAREDAQQSLTAKRERADAVIENSGSTESAAAQVAAFWHDLVGSSPE